MEEIEIGDEVICKPGFEARDLKWENNETFEGSNAGGYGYEAGRIFVVAEITPDIVRTR